MEENGCTGKAVNSNFKGLLMENVRNEMKCFWRLTLCNADLPCDCGFIAQSSEEVFMSVVKDPGHLYSYY